MTSTSLSGGNAADRSDPQKRVRRLTRPAIRSDSITAHIALGTLLSVVHFKIPEPILIMLAALAGLVLFPGPK